MKIEANGVLLNVEQRGAGAPALVFLHYWGGSSRTWRRVIEALAPEFRTVAIDQRGWGRSEAPATGYALADMANDVEGVIEALDLERYILIGHSMGGKVSQLMASRHPRGLAGLALIAPSPPSPLNLPLEVRQGMVRAYDTRASIIATVEQVLAPNGLNPRGFGNRHCRQSGRRFRSQEGVAVVREPGRHRGRRGRHRHPDPCRFRRRRSGRSAARSTARTASAPSAGAASCVAGSRPSPALRGA